MFCKPTAHLDSHHHQCPHEYEGSRGTSPVSGLVSIYITSSSIVCPRDDLMSAYNELRNRGSFASCEHPLICQWLVTSVCIHTNRCGQTWSDSFHVSSILHCSVRQWNVHDYIMMHTQTQRRTLKGKIQSVSDSKWILSTLKTEDFIYSHGSEYDFLISWFLNYNLPTQFISNYKLSKAGRILRL